MLHSSEMDERMLRDSSEATRPVLNTRLNCLEDRECEEGSSERAPVGWFGLLAN